MFSLPNGVMPGSPAPTLSKPSMSTAWLQPIIDSDNAKAYASWQTAADAVQQSVNTVWFQQASLAAVGQGPAPAQPVVPKMRWAYDDGSGVEAYEDVQPFYNLVFPKINLPAPAAQNPGVIANSSPEVPGQQLQYIVETLAKIAARMGIS